MAHPEAPAFNPADPAFRFDPYPAYARLRRDDPVHEAPWGGWVISRHADCIALLSDPRASSDPSHSQAYRRARDRGLISGDEALSRSPPFLIRDPPDHTRLRRLVSRAFTPRAVEALRPRIQQVVDELLSRALEEDETELIEEIAYPLPVRVICELLGVPPEDQETFKGWSRLLSRAIDPDPLLPAEVIAGRREAGNAFADYFRRLGAERRKTPRDDLLSALVQAEEAGDRLSEDELLSTCILLLAAGHETTVSLIANGVLALLRHPDEFRRLRTEPGLVRGAVEEVLRFDAPVQFAFRTAKQDIEIRGRTIPQGAQIILLLASANRDNGVFPDGNAFDIARSENAHLAFGHGIHYCLGAPLARLEGEIFFSTLARRCARLDGECDRPGYAPNIVNRRLAALPVSLRPA